MNSQLSGHSRDELGIEGSRTNVLESRRNGLEDRDGVLLDGQVDCDLPGSLDEGRKKALLAFWEGKHVTARRRSQNER